MLRIASAVVMALLLGACAIDYAGKPMNLSASTSKTILVGVSDERAYVVSGNKTPEFVGLVRGAVGNPFDVYTASGQPLASDFANAISQSLATNGSKATTMSLSSSQSREQTRRLMALQGRDRSLLVTIDEWKSDKYFKTKLIYSLRAEVLDRKGQVLASNFVEEKAGTGAGSDAANRAISRLLDTPAMVAALE